MIDIHKIFECLYDLCFKHNVSTLEHVSFIYLLSLIINKDASIVHFFQNTWSATDFRDYHNWLHGPLSVFYSEFNKKNKNL